MDVTVVRVHSLFHLRAPAAAAEKDKQGGAAVVCVLTTAPFHTQYCLLVFFEVSVS